MIRRIVTILCLCLCIILTLTACGEKPDGAMEPVMDVNGNITGYERKYHNDNGDITRWDVYDANEQYDHYILYEYDSNDRLAKETYYDASGFGVWYNAYSYSDEGSLAEKDYASAKEGSTRTLYDSDGNEKERFTYDNNDQLSKYEVYQNDIWVEAELPTEPQTEDVTE